MFLQLLTRVVFGDQFADGHRGLDPAALGHAIVHQDQLVHGLAIFEAAFDSLDSLVTVGANFAILVELFEETLDRAAVEEVIFHQQNLILNMTTFLPLF